MDIAAIKPHVHPIAVEFELVQPSVAVGCFVNEFGELWLDELRQCSRIGAPVHDPQIRLLTRSGKTRPATV